MTDNCCFVCCENFNKSTRQKIVCEFGDCNYTACKTCIRSYLLNIQNDPHCMNCKRGYTQAYIIKNLNRSFNDNAFKEHKKKLLLDGELSRIPETMQAAEKYKKIEGFNLQIKEKDEKIKKLNQEVNKLQQEKRTLVHNINNLRNGKECNEEKKKFIFPCPAENCRGYLSTQYKCEICKLHTCPHCHEIIGHNRDEPHTCNPDSVASAEEIKKTSKGCPNCGIRIQKISGCDQMYCTECRVAFSWNTGKTVTGPIHNPHYYQIMAQENNGVATRNPQDVLCGGLVVYHIFSRNILRKLMDIKTKKYNVNGLHYTMNTLHRTVNHITNYELVTYRTQVRTLMDNEDLRVEYINNKISKEQLSKEVYSRDKKRKKIIDILQIYELLSVVGIENFTSLVNCKLQSEHFIREVIKVFETYTNLIKYTNRELKLISITYNSKVSIIDENFAVQHKKFVKSQLQSILDENTSGQGCSTDPLP